MAERTVQPADGESSGNIAGDEAGIRELRRLTGDFAAKQRDWRGEGSTAAALERQRLTEMIYALSDLDAQAQEMQLDVLANLLGMALQETLTLLRDAEQRG